jgi:glycosyltransferase involved in cell wall biosynthesis
MNFYRDKTIEEQHNFIFFVSSFWKKNINTNVFRQNFMDCCFKFSNLRFDLGFIPRNDDFNVEGDFLFRKKKLKIKDYVLGYRKSIICFSTPAVYDCHGWKLGEFIAMEKVILSTPLSRVMPGNFLNGTHYFETDGSAEDIYEKLNTLLSDKSKRNEIKNNIKVYFNDFLTPSRVIERIINHLGSQFSG